MSGAVPAGAGNWVMWEARATAGRTPELLAWVLQNADRTAQVYVSEDRVVAICPVNASATEGVLLEPPAELLGRPAYQWEFARIR
jgi:hypothetical protein